MKRHLPAILFGLLCVFGLAALRFADPYPVRAVREIAFDQVQRVEPRPYAALPVRIVDIDEASLAALGQWPWPRTQVAALAERLHGLGAAAIVFDALFVEPDRMSPSRIGRDPRILAAFGEEVPADFAERLPDNDAVFAQTISGLPVVLGFGVTRGTDSGRPGVKAGFSYTGENPFAAPPRFAATTQSLPRLQEAAAGVGSISLSPASIQGVVRKVPLLWSDGEKLYPSLALEGLRVAQGASTILVHGAHNVDGIVSSVRVGDFEIPTTGAGELWLHYTRDHPERYISAKDVLSEEASEALRDRIEGQIVLIGTSATGLLDIRPTALGESVPGVSIHAQALEQILLGHFLNRPDWLDFAEILSFATIGIVVTVAVVLAGPTLSLLLGALVGIGIVTASLAAFKYGGLLLDPTFPLVGGLAVHFAMTSYRYLVADREKRTIRRAFAHYVAPSVLREIEKNPASVHLGGDEREVTVMFVDVRNFTPLSEKLSATELVGLLNRLLGQLSELIVEEEGTIDKYIGDSIMAFWNAPVDVAQHELRACRAALRMRARLAELNATDSFDLGERGRNMPPLEIGVGINSGTACVGNMGSESRFDYSVIGDTVNIASRVESACRHVQFDIVASESTAAEARALALLPAGSIALKGKSDRTPISIVVGDEELRASPSFRALEEAHGRLLAAAANGDSAAVSSALAECLALAARVSPRLPRFYERIRERPEDFRAA